jgi:hypothetical protein
VVTDPLLTGSEALGAPFSAFPSWFMPITYDRCGKDRLLFETHTPQHDTQVREIIAKVRHDGCGGRADDVELLTGIEGASNRPVRRIVLLDGCANPGSAGAPVRWRQRRLSNYLCAADFPLPGLVAPVSVVPSAVPLPVPALGIIPDE